MYEMSPKKPGIVAHACDLSTWEAGKGLPWTIE